MQALYLKKYKMHRPCSCPNKSGIFLCAFSRSVLETDAGACLDLTASSFVRLIKVPCRNIPYKKTTSKLY